MDKDKEEFDDVATEDNLIQKMIDKETALEIHKSETDSFLTN